LLWETVFAVRPSPDLVLVFAAMIGLPLYLRVNGK
jgi:hypothetical protein